MIRRVVVASVVLLIGLLAAQVWWRPFHLPTGVLVAEVVLAVWLIVAIETNPLNRRFLRRYEDRTLRFRALDEVGEPHPTGDELVKYGVSRVGAVADADGDDAMVFDLYQPANRMVTIGLGRLTGSLLVITALDGDRFAVSSTSTVLPTDRLVVNSVPGAALQTLLASHRRLLDEVRANGARHRSAPPEAFAEVMRLEHEAYRALGPVVGSFCHLGRRPRSLRLLYWIDPVEVRRMGLSALQP